MVMMLMLHHHEVFEPYLIVKFAWNPHAWQYCIMHVHSGNANFKRILNVKIGIHTWFLKRVALGYVFLWHDRPQDPRTEPMKLGTYRAFDYHLHFEIYDLYHPLIY